MAENGNGKRRQVRPDVLRYLVRRTGEICFLKDIVTETGFTERQVQSCIAHMREEGVPIVVETRARAWRYTADHETATTPKNAHRPEDDDVFERVGTTKTGKIIVRGDSGTLYVLHELEI
jgi:hypothetical protein